MNRSLYLFVLAGLGCSAVKPTLPASSPKATATEPAKSPEVVESSKRVEETNLVDGVDLRVVVYEDLDLSTLKDRQRWRRQCLKSPRTADFCDLSEVIPFNKRWWEHVSGDLPMVQLRAAKIEGKEPTILHYYLTKSLERGEGFSKDSYAYIDAKTGKLLKKGVIESIAGRPFEHRLAGDVNTNTAAERWARQALEEHASVASFARHALELMSLGAPLWLLQQVTEAQQDEVRHAYLCKSKAEELGYSLSFEVLDTQYRSRTTPLEVALGVVREGCINETLSYLALQQACDKTPKSNQTLHEIADDERRHVRLAWTTLQWLFSKLDSYDRDEVISVLWSEWPISQLDAARALLPGWIAGLSETAANRAFTQHQEFAGLVS